MITAAVTELFRDLERGALAIASTPRLARQIEQRYAQWKMRAGETAWPTPRIRVYDDWLQEIWLSRPAQAPGAPRLLSDDQELLLWEQVIQGNSGGVQAPYLLQLASTARTARQSWRRIHEWDLDWGGLQDHRGADAEALVAWAYDLQKILSDNHWITPAQLVSYLLDHPDAWSVGRTAGMWWMGFDTVPGTLARLMDVLRDHGVRQSHYRNPGVSSPEVAAMECTDAEDQWRRIAGWARHELSLDPELALGVVCPDLQGQRDAIEDVLEEVLHPELAWRVDAPRTYHIALGRPVAEYPIIRTALDLLHWTDRRIPFEALSRALRSPYLGSDADFPVRLELELQLRSRRQESFTLGYLGNLARGLEQGDRFAASLAVAMEIPLPQSATPAEWAGVFSQWLRACGWPGERPLDSHEFQTMSAWRDQLARFAALAVVRSRWTLEEARTKFSSTMSMRTLQFHDDQAPLQIMGAREAAGLWFDKLWLADMSDAVWPPAPRPDPFIPVSRQKACGMPDASAQSVLEHTRASTEDLLAGARWIRVSFVSAQEGTPAALSPLFAVPPAADEGGGHDYPGRSRQLARHPAPLELTDDQQAPALELDRLPGGVAVVADQAKCPFRALAHHRLKARKLAEGGPGLDAGQRGTLVHDAARRIWEALRDQGTLLSMQEAEVRRVVSESVARAVAALFADSPFQRRFLEIECDRLEALFQEWLALESQRAPFRVLETEFETDLELGGVRFRLRVDRIDELADGRRLLIDYKTGQLARVGDWRDPRMEEPQLPMYALSRSDDVAALVLAGIRRGQCELRGVGDAVPGMPTLKAVADLGFEDMPRLRSWWRSALGELVAEYRRGVARVDPKDARTCRLCDAASLCRIFERDRPVPDESP